MLRDRRLLAVVVGALVLGAPAGVLSALCTGRACARPEPETPVPFCSLPRDLRDLIAAGFRDARSPHVLAVAGDTTIAVGTTAPGAPWPAAGDDDRVPLVLWGAAVHPEAEVPAGTTLDAVAPSVSEAIGLTRPHPRVRSGEAISGIATGNPVRLVVEVVLKGVGSRDLERRPRTWPELHGLVDEGAGTLDARPGSVPLDPAAVVTTIGTGGLPSQHGITGTLVRNEDGAVTAAWGPEAPFSVIAGLGDDLDELRRQEPRIGLVAADATDRGLIGGDWYVGGDRDDVVLEAEPLRAVGEAERLLESGYGTDDVPDLLGVVLEGPASRLDEAVGALSDAAERASGGTALVVVTATGSGARSGPVLFGDDVERSLEEAVGSDVVEAVVPGGFFLDQAALTEQGLTDDEVVRALRRLRSPDGGGLFEDAFPAIAVTFARYC